MDTQFSIDVIIMHCISVPKYLMYCINIYTYYVLMKLKNEKNIYFQTLKCYYCRLGAVAQACNPSTLGLRWADQEVRRSRTSRLTQ